MATKTYKNPPITEAIFELRSVLDGEVSSHQVDSFFELIKDDFPTREVKKRNQVRIDTQKNQVDQLIAEFDQFSSIDGRYLVQIEQARLSIHRLKPYISWSSFFPTIQKVLESYFAAYKVVSFDRIGMRYINQFMAPKEAGSNNIFNIEYRVPDAMKGDFESALCNFLINVGNESSDKIKILVGTPPEALDPKPYILDIDYYSKNTSITSPENCSDWAQEAHTCIEDIFESSLNEVVKEEFNT